MTANDRLKEIEYENLYKEITEHNEKVDRIMHWCIAGSFAFLGAISAFDFTKFHILQISKNECPLILLIPLVFILPSIKLVTSHLNSIVRIATFIMVFYEKDNVGISWQSNIQKFRQQRNRYLGKAIISLLPGLALLFFLLSIVSALQLFFEVKLADLSHDVEGRIFSWIVLLIVYGLVIWKGLKLNIKLNNLWSTETFQEYSKEWNQIKNFRQ